MHRLAERPRMQNSAFTARSEQTGEMASKYDVYWAGRLPQIRAELQLAATGVPAVVGVPDLRRLGTRGSWYGVAEVRGQQVTRSSMAHSASLGKTVAASGICERWPERTFRFTIGAGGDVLTITTAADHQTRPGGPTARPREQAHRVHAHDVLQPGRRAAPGQRSRTRGTAGDRQADTDEFYMVLGDLARYLGGPRRLRDCTVRNGWPRHGVYFFYEDGETRADGSGRVVRVGTHALTAASKTTLWSRLRQHRGQLTGRNPGGGNHRASVFRRHVGAALIRRRSPHGDLLASWLDRHRPTGERASQEAQIELEVSRYIGAMPFLWLGVPGRADRGYIERNSIALLSCLTGGADTPGGSWLGCDAARTEISGSGRWNVDHIHDRYEPDFLQRLAQLVERQQ
jgi:hypothetical protein